MMAYKRTLCVALSLALLAGLSGCSPRAGAGAGSSLDRLVDSLFASPQMEEESYREGEDIFENMVIAPAKLPDDEFVVYSRVSHQVLFQQDIPYKQLDETGTLLLSDMCGPSDLWQENTKYPFVLFVHGGSWSNGDKQSARTEIITLAHHGYVAVSLDYRKLPDWGLNEMVEDVLDAFKFYFDRADEFGIDPDNMYLLGTSGGAHIALLSAYSMGEGYVSATRTRSYAFDIKGVCTFASPVNVGEELLLTQLTKVFGDDAPAACTTLLGATLQANTDRVRRADPLLLISERVPPTLIMQGQRDEVVGWEDAQLLYDSLVAQDIDTELTLYEDLGHEFEQATLLQRVDGFIQSRL